MLKRFEKLSNKDQKALINSICHNKDCAEEANEAFQTILGRPLHLVII